MNGIMQDTTQAMDIKLTTISMTYLDGVLTTVILRPTLIPSYLITQVTWFVHLVFSKFC